MTVIPPEVAQAIVRGMLSLPVVIFRTDSEGIFTQSCGKGLEALGLRDGEVIGESVFDLYPEVKEEIQRALGGWSGYFESYGETNGSAWHFVTHVAHDGSTGGVIGVAFDLTERFFMENELRESEASFRALSEAAYEGIVVHDQGEILGANTAICEMLGMNRSELIGADVFAWIHEDYRELAQASAREERDTPFRLQLRRKDGTFFPVEARGRTINYHGRQARVVAARDLTVLEKAAQLTEEKEKLEELSLTDDLTKVGNRRFFDEELRARITSARRAGHGLSLLLLDIDFFKRVNDQQGHPTGDRVLRRLGRLLRSLQRDTDATARYGGEEFAVLLSDGSRERARIVAERVRRKVETVDFSDRRTERDGPPLRITVSIGVASSEDFHGAKALVKAADRALYRAKQNGRNRVEVEVASDVE